VLLTAAGARAEEHVSGFANLSEPQSTTTLEDWGPVPTDKESIANLAPGLLPFFNNGPVFGLPGTVTGDFWDQTQLTGDWDGARTDMTRRDEEARARAMPGREAACINETLRALRP